VRRREWRKAIARGSELLRRDPFREHIHRELMKCHYAMGNRPAAVRQFSACVRILREELDIDPMAETRALIEGIRRASAFPGDEATSGSSAFRGPAPKSRRRTVG
jgi:DNA-binding SARP family transcriptional activator